MCSENEEMDVNVIEITSYHFQLNKVLSSIREFSMQRYFCVYMCITCVCVCVCVCVCMRVCMRVF